MEETHHSSKGHGLWSQTDWVQILALTLAGCAISSKLVMEFSRQEYWSGLPFPTSQMVKNLPAMQETRVGSMVLEDLLEKGSLPTPVFLPGEFLG